MFYLMPFKSLRLTMKTVKKTLPLSIQAHHATTAETPKEEGGSLGLLVHEGRGRKQLLRFRFSRLDPAYGENLQMARAEVVRQVRSFSLKSGLPALSSGSGSRERHLSESRKKHGRRPLNSTWALVPAISAHIITILLFGSGAVTPFFQACTAALQTLDSLSFSSCSM